MIIIEVRVFYQVFDLGLTWLRGRVTGYTGQPGKNKKKIFEILIFHMKKLRNNLYEYKLYML
jgi:hypothetical protein